jgi:XTP/dITP diphosphohydrolase
MILLVATRSSGKQRELRRLFEGSGIEVVFPEDLGLAPSPEEDALEMADSFEANARHKAEWFARKTKMATVADDSGLEVFSLGGSPGTRSKRFSGHEGLPDEVDEANTDELLRRLAGAPEAKRGARYVCALAFLARPDAPPKSFEGTTPGHILEQREGTAGFGYDSVVFSTDLGKPFGLATPEEKDRVSHRGRAFRALKDYLEQHPF